MMYNLVLSPPWAARFDLQSFLGDEAVSRPFSYRLCLLARNEQPVPDMDDKDIGFAVQAEGGATRWFGGIVLNWRRVHPTLRVYEAEVGPRLMRLSRRVSSLPACRPMRKGEAFRGTSRRTPLGSITTMRGERGMGSTRAARAG